MVLALVVIAALSTPAVAPVSAPVSAVLAAAEATWTWPVVGPIVVAFDPPDSPYGTGHRGIDVAAALGTEVLAPADGVVTFAGPVGGRLFVTVDHGGGVLSTSSFLSSVTVHRGDAVSTGQVVGSSGPGHTGEPLARPALQRPPRRRVRRSDDLPADARSVGVAPPGAGLTRGG